MKLTKISNENINKLFQNNECKKEIMKKYNNDFTKKIYNLLYRAITTNINIKIINTKEKITLDLSVFIPEHIKEYINSQKYIIYKINISISNKNFIIYVFTEKQNKIDINKLAYYFKIILYVCTINSTYNENNFTFKIFLTDFPKIEPVTEVEPKHINSGYTINHKSIVIFRKEELYKVFIHECFHLFCLDFSNIQGINYVKLFEPLFKIKSDYLLFESFCEYWARTINCAVVAYHSKPNITFKEFEILFQININVERCFSLLQMNHFLKTMNLTYREIIKGKETNKTNKYRETTNGICYYVITGLLMYNFEETMDWFTDNNQGILNFSKNNKNIYLFIDFIKSIYNKKELIIFIEKLNTIPIKNMYMSAFEIQIL